MFTAIEHKYDFNQLHNQPLPRMSQSEIVTIDRDQSKPTKSAFDQSGHTKAGFDQSASTKTGMDQSGPTKAGMDYGLTDNTMDSPGTYAQRKSFRENMRNIEPVRCLCCTVFKIY